MPPKSRHSSPRIRRLELVKVLGGLAALLLFACAPAILGLYWLRVLTTVLMFAAFTQSINIMAGFVGYPAFGNVVFFGLGAYGTAVAIVKFDLPAAAGLMCGLAACA